MNENVSIVKLCFPGFLRQGCSLPLTMNVQQRYIRLFPSLLGNSRICLSKHFFSDVSTKQEQGPPDVRRKCEPNLESNPYYQKYAEKINKLKETNFHEFERRMKLLTENYEQATPQVENDDSQDDSNVKASSVTENSSTLKKGKKKSLNSILKLDMISDLSADKIGALWVDHFSKKDAVCAVIPNEAFHIIQTSAQTFTTFVYPIPRKDGYEMFVGQFESPDFHFTSLINYQRHQENAPAQLTLNHYTELLEEKGIVLMSGMVTDEHISVTDAQLLSYLVQYFHTEHPNLLRDFNRSPENFDFQSIISAMDSGLAARAGVSAQN